MTELGNKGKKGLLEDELKQADKEIGRQFILQASLKSILYLIAAAILLGGALLWGYRQFMGS